MLPSAEKIHMCASSSFLKYLSAELNTHLESTLKAQIRLPLFQRHYSAHKHKIPSPQHFPNYTPLSLTQHPNTQRTKCLARQEPNQWAMKPPAPEHNVLPLLGRCPIKTDMAAKKPKPKPGITILPAPQGPRVQPRRALAVVVIATAPAPAAAMLLVRGSEQR